MGLKAADAAPAPEDSCAVLCRLSAMACAMLSTTRLHDGDGPLYGG
jgi:hypothetical protein